MDLVGDLDPVSLDRLSLSRSPDLHHSRRGESESGVPMAQSSSSHSLQRSDISSSSTKEEKIQQDKAAVHRYHNSLRRAKKKLSHEMETGEEPRNYASVYNETPSYPVPETESGRGEQDTVRPFCFEGTPQLRSKEGSKTDLRSAGNGEQRGERKVDPPSPEKTRAYAEEGTPDVALSKSSSLGSLRETEKQRRSVNQTQPVSNVDSPTFSRQSSVESLNSCDQRSVKSHLPSAYSTQVPTGMVSPSDLPDSPGQSCPGSPPNEESQVVGKRGQSPEADKVSSLAHGSCDSAPRRFGQEGEPQSGHLSAASSLSALTIDSETKIKTCRNPLPALSNNVSGTAQGEIYLQNEEPEYATFDRGRESEILEETIRSAVPSRRSDYHGHRSTESAVFKVPKRPPPKKSENCGSSGLSSRGEPEDTVKTFNYEGDVNEAYKSTATKPDGVSLPSGTCSVSCPSSRAEPASAGDSIRAVIKSAMPKPKPPKQFGGAGRSGKAVAIAKPMVRKPADVSEAPPQRSVSATGSGDQRKSHSHRELSSLEQAGAGATKPRGAGAQKYDCDSSIKEREKSLDDFISLAMPKPKPERLRKTPQKGKGCATIECSPKMSPVSSVITAATFSPKRNGSAVLAEIASCNDEEKGILEASGISTLVERSQDSLLMKFSNVSTNLEDIRPPEGLMDISVSSCSLMRNSATSEKVRDASNLLLKGCPPGSKQSSPQKEPSVEKEDTPVPGAEEEPVASGVVKTSSEGSESLSEDNYSRIDEDENLDISPEDIDLNLVEEDAKKLMVELEGGAVAEDELFPGDELLIECETLSLVSSTSHVTATTTDGESDPEFKNCAGAKVVRGGGGRKPKPPTVPKVAVRTTKTAELRAKRASESSNDGGGRGSRASGQSPRPDIPRSGSNASDSSGKGTKFGTYTKSKSVPATSKSKLPPPPVPPKPKKLMGGGGQAAVAGNKTVTQSAKKNGTPVSQKKKTEQLGSPSARISPFNYNKTPPKKLEEKQKSPGQGQKNPGQRGSSKKMLVTTV